MDITGHCMVSIAISLKQIADAMEKPTATTDQARVRPAFGHTTSVKK